MRTALYIWLIVAALIAGPACAYDKKLKPLHRAAYSNNTILLKTWIDKGEDVNEPAVGGLTPLHIAAYEGSTESVQMLLESGANPNLRDSKDRTALDLAFLGKHTDISGLLIPVTDTAKDAPADQPTATQGDTP